MFYIKNYAILYNWSANVLPLRTGVAIISNKTQR